MTVARIGVSACLIGDRVRYDGGDKLNQRLLSIFESVDRVAVCPEAELGLGVPRPPMHLGVDGDRVRLVVTEDGRDLTDSMESFAHRRLLEIGDLDGYVLKSKSPSCALTSAPLGGRNTLGAGLFAARVMADRPLLPVCEEGALESAGTARHFVRRVFHAFRLRLLFAREWSVGDLERHHARHEPLLSAHDPVATATLSTLLAAARDRSPVELGMEYRVAAASILEAEAAEGALLAIDGIDVAERAALARCEQVVTTSD